MNDQNQAQTGRRDFVKMGAAAAAAVAGVALVGGDNAAQAAGTAIPNLYPNWNATQFRSIQADENAHVAFLKTALGTLARPKPNFKTLLQPNIRAFATVSQGLENTGVGAYLGAVPVVFSKQYLSAAGSIALIEARHAGYLNVLFNDLSTVNVMGMEQDFDKALTIAEVVALAGPYIQDLNGGPPLTFNATPSRSNDIAILNFALALEYLEAEFYNINVPVFYPTR